MERIPPRLLYHINNLDLLHKSKEEGQVDILQQKARSNERVMNDWEGDGMLDDTDDNEVDNVIDDHDEMTTNVNTIIEEIISSPSMGENDWYVHEATDANLDAGYLSSQSSDASAVLNIFHYCSTPIDEMKWSIEMAKQEMIRLAERTMINQPSSEPFVFVTGPAEMKAAIQIIGDKYTLI